MKLINCSKQIYPINNLCGAHKFRFIPLHVFFCSSNLNIYRIYPLGIELLLTKKIYRLFELCDNYTLDSIFKINNRFRF